MPEIDPFSEWPETEHSAETEYLEEEIYAYLEYEDLKKVREFTKKRRSQFFVPLFGAACISLAYNLATDFSKFAIDALEHLNHFQF